jgi:hypothetical protein
VCSKTGSAEIFGGPEYDGSDLELSGFVSLTAHL